MAFPYDRELIIMWRPIPFSQRNKFNRDFFFFFYVSILTRIKAQQKVFRGWKPDDYKNEWPVTSRVIPDHRQKRIEVKTFDVV